MENSWSWEQKTLIGELIQGMELARQLREHLVNSTSSFETRDFLAQRILSSYEKALFILNWSGNSMKQQLPPQQQALVESPLSMNGSSKSDDFDAGIKENQTHYEASKKRKAMPRWTDHVKVNSKNGLEGPNEDGYSWRKYGQKDILGAKYPRSYYRCTYRNTQNCWATKQVQRSDDDPTIFEVTYRGTHTCLFGNQIAPPPPQSPEIPEQRQNSESNKQNQTENALYALQKSLRVNTDGLDNNDLAPPFTFPSTYAYVKNVNNYSHPFVSPSTPEPYYYSPFEPNGLEGFQHLHNSEADLADIISAHTSATSSPIVDLDFSLDPVEFDKNFPINDMSFFA